MRTGITCFTLILLCSQFCFAGPSEDLVQAKSLRSLGKWSEAESLCRKVMAAATPCSALQNDACAEMLTSIEQSNKPDHLYEVSNEILASASPCKMLVSTALFYIGRALQLQNKHQESLEYFTKVEKSYPDQLPWYYWALYRKAEVYRSLDMDEASLDTISKVVSDYPGKATRAQFTWSCVAKVQMLQKHLRFKEATDCLDKLFTENPNFLTTSTEDKPNIDAAKNCLGALGTCCENTRDWERGVRIVWATSVIPDLDPSLRPIYQSYLDVWKTRLPSSRDFDIYMAAVQEWGKDTPAEFGGTLNQVKLANAAHLAKDFGKALLLYQTAFRALGPQNKPGIQVATWIRDAYVLGGNNTAAMSFARPLVRSPWQGDVPNQVTAAALVSGVIASASGSASVLQWYAFLGGTEKTDPSPDRAPRAASFEDISPSIVQAPTSQLERDALFACLSFFVETADNIGASETMRLLSQKYSSDPSAAQRVVVVLQDTDRLVNNGIMIADHAIKFATGEPEIYNQLAALHYKSGHADEAVPLLTKYIETADPSRVTPPVRLTLALAYLNSGKSKEGREMLGDLISSASNTYEARKAQFLIAYDSINSGNMAGGKQELQTLMTRYPDTEEAKQAKTLYDRLSASTGPR